MLYILLLPHRSMRIIHCFFIPFYLCCSNWVNFVDLSSSSHMVSSVISICYWVCPISFLLFSRTKQTTTVIHRVSFAIDHERNSRASYFLALRYSLRKSIIRLFTFIIAYLCTQFLSQICLFFLHMSATLFWTLTSSGWTFFFLLILPTLRREHK